MTAHEPTPAASAGTPLLWPNKRIGEYAINVTDDHVEQVHLYDGMVRVRDEMQAELDALRAANVELRAQLQEAQAWQPLEAYSEIYAETEDGERCTIGIDGDDNLYVLKQNPPSLVLTMTQGKYRLCGGAPASPPASDGARTDDA